MKKINVKSLILRLVITFVIAGIYYYKNYPPLNIHSGAFWTFLILIDITFMVLTLLGRAIKNGKHAKDFEVVTDAKVITAGIWENYRIPACIFGAIILICIIGNLVGFVGFRASSYSKLLPLETGSFAEEVDEINWQQIPMLDSASANTLANRKLGELSELVSQFEVSEDSAQINYQGSPVRVTYLEYGGLVKWWKNKDNGIPAYIMIDMCTQETHVVRLDEGIKYSPSELFNRNIYRYLQFQYPTKIFDNVDFEIDEEGTPYWVASTITKTIGLFGGEDIEGAVLVNAITGECSYYDVDDIPSWVDRVYSADLLMTQYDYYGRYNGGFINSLFGQSGCTVSTDGYNYLAMDDDVWLYTGVTSLGGDESNIGFILVNQRTKEARYYPCAGANEYSGMDSAEGAVQQYSYSATFPLLLNISDQPTYFMALKDASELVKMYAMVNVQQYQIVATGTTVQACLSSYLSMLSENNIITEAEPVLPDQDTVSGTIETIDETVIEGYSNYIIKLVGKSDYYRITSATDPMAAILEAGDKVELVYDLPSEDADSELREVTELTIE